MINKENLNKLYKDVLEGVELTTKELNSFGFNSKDLNDLIEQGSIIRVKRGLYALKSVDELFYYGKQLIAQKEYDKATQCFQKCFEIDPTHTGVWFQLFLRCIQNKDYEKAFEYFDIFYNSQNEFYNADSNFYLYLLSMITPLPENYREYARFLKLEDFGVDFKDRYANVYLQSKVRLSALNQRFTLAAKQLNEAIQEKGSLSVQDIIIETLLAQAIEVQIQNRNNVINLIKQKKFEDIIEFYKKMEFSHHLSISDSYAFILANELLNIINTKNIPEKMVFSSDNMFEAIAGKNYELALSLSTARNQKYNIKKDNNYLSLLLDEIVSKCRELSGSVRQEQKITPVTIVEKTPKPSEESSVIEHKSSLNVVTSSFADIIKFLMNGDLDNSFRTLRSYLTSLNKSDYEFLIIDLIKISLLEKDIAFAKPMTALTLISRENYSFDISTYIQEFYIKLSQNRFEEARIYLDIISKGNKLGQDCVITNGLYQVLESLERMLNYKRNNTVLNTVDETLENSQKSPIENFQQQINYNESQEQPIEVMLPKKQVKVQSKPIQKEDITQEKRNSEKKFMDKKYEELLDKKGVILLKPMANDKIDRILEMVENYQDMVAFVIDEGNKHQIVLRYKPTINEYVDTNNLLKLGDQAYEEENYDECIANYSQLLQIKTNPKSRIYSKLGLAYMKKRQIPLAIDYLRIATNLSKTENSIYDFTELIADLKGKMSSEDRKPIFRMTQKDFDYSDVNDYYGIDNFDEINAFINESESDVETACEQLGLSFEEIDIIKLIYAREFYFQEKYEKGDKFLKSVEKSKNKTKYTKEIFEEVRKNKRFYHNHKKENNIELVLTLSPKK